MAIEQRGSSTGYVTNKVNLLDGSIDTINLGLATSPIGPAEELRPLLRERDPLSDLAEYPNDPTHTATRRLILNYVGLDTHVNAVILNGNGSYGAGDEVTRYLAQQGAQKFHATNYSFPNAEQWTRRHPRIVYSPVDVDSLNPIDSLASMRNLSRGDLAGNIVYVDYPNNPYGLADPNLVREVVKHTVENGGTPIVDLAFGEVLGEEFQEIINFTFRHGGISLASLSKTQGCPGLRTGYAILPEHLTNNGYSGDQKKVFGLNREAEFVYTKLMETSMGNEPLAKIHARRVAKYNRNTNQELKIALEALGLKVEPTNLETPIQVVRDGADFHQRLTSLGIITESLADYQNTLGQQSGYGDSAVRMLTPRPRDLTTVIERIKSLR